MDNKFIYYEYGLNYTMPSYPFFLEKINTIEKIIGPKKIKKYIKLPDIEPARTTNGLNCRDCLAKNFYQIGGIVWFNNLKHKINTHQFYPSEYFIKCILNICLIKKYISNPPMYLNNDQLKNFYFVPLHYNKLLILDALLHQGSFPRYENTNKYIYSEHSGVISIKNRCVHNIIIATDTNRQDINDDNIYLPSNSDLMLEHEYLFHTHPNMKKLGGRIDEGIVYEFPSANDILNFIKYYNNGKAQASIVISPEGIYVIRPIWPNKKYDIGTDFFYFLKKYILKLEKIATKRISDIVHNISDPDVFHDRIGRDTHCIKLYNKFIGPENLFIEYYPREKKNFEWRLPSINLPFIEFD